MNNTYPEASPFGREVLDVGEGFLVQHVPVAFQRPAGDRRRRGGQDHALHRAGLHAGPQDVERALDTELDQLFLQQSIEQARCENN